MKNKTYILFLIYYLLINISLVGQITINNIEGITITDQMNWNFEKVNTFNWEIRFTDNIELWHTKQISSFEFQQEVFKQQTDSLYSNLFLNDKDSSKFLYEKTMEYLNNAYLSYCDTVTPEFIKYIPKQVIINLLEGLQDITYDVKKFKALNQISNEVTYGNKVSMTSYYPLVGMTLYSSEGDTLIVSNNGQQDLMIPWHHKKMNVEICNPLINWSLDAILPEEMNYNKKRLTKGLRK